MLRSHLQPDHPLGRAFTAFLGAKGYPCVGAKAAANSGGLSILIARDFRSAWDDLSVSAALLDLVIAYRREPARLRSLAVLFEAGPPDDETAFESKLWQRIASLSDKDEWLGQPADPTVSPDPADPHFALSFGGEAFFLVGLHPRASRPARRFRCPAMVFNLHAQFERLRDDGRFDPIQRTIRERDAALAGSINPMLSDHGDLSAARQYSGRAVGANWRCPFRGRGAAAG